MLIEENVRNLLWAFVWAMIGSVLTLVVVRFGG